MDASGVLHTFFILYRKKYNMINIFGNEVFYYNHKHIEKNAKFFSKNLKDLFLDFDV